VYLEINNCGIHTTYIFWSTHHGKPDRKCFVGVHSASQSGCEFESYFITFGLLKIVEIVENCGKLTEFNRQNYYTKPIFTFVVGRYRANLRNISFQTKHSAAHPKYSAIQLT
jgi:hypothetical protein